MQIAQHSPSGDWEIKPGAHLIAGHNVLEQSVRETTACWSYFMIVVFFHNSNNIMSIAYHTLK